MSDKIIMGGSAVQDGVMLKTVSYKVIAAHTPDGLKIEQSKDSIPKIVKIVGRLPLIRGILIPFMMMWDKLKSFKAKLIYAVSMFGMFGMFAYAVTQGWHPELTWLNFVVPSLMLFIIGFSILCSLKLEPLQDLFRYHGAEHIAVNAYENEIPLTIDAVKDIQTFHPRCGSNMLALMAVLSIVILIGLHRWIPAFWGIWIMQILGIEIFIIGHKFKSIGRLTNMGGKAFQKFTALQPEEKHLQAGLAAAITLIKLEQSKSELDMNTTIYETYDMFLEAQ